MEMELNEWPAGRRWVFTASRAGSFEAQQIRVPAGNPLRRRKMAILRFTIVRSHWDKIAIGQLVRGFVLFFRNPELADSPTPIPI